MSRPGREKPGFPGAGTTQRQDLGSTEVLCSFVAQLLEDARKSGKSHGGDRVSKDWGKMVMFLGSSTQCQGLN